MPKRPRLRLPLVLTSVALGSAAAIVACSPDEAMSHYFCVEHEPRVDASPVADAGPAPDATPCGQVVTDPAQCPPGCDSEPLG